MAFPLGRSALKKFAVLPIIQYMDDGFGHWRDTRHDEGDQMAHSIARIEAIGEVRQDTVDRLASPLSHALAGDPDQAGQRELHSGVPADLVDLSIDARFLQRLASSQHLRFLVDDENSQVIVQIVDSVSNEVIRQIPMDELRRHLQG